MYVEEMYESWRVDPTSVHKSWDVYFRQVENGAAPGVAYVSPPSISSTGAFDLVSTSTFFSDFRMASVGCIVYSIAKGSGSLTWYRLRISSLINFRGSLDRFRGSLDLLFCGSCDLLSRGSFDLLFYFAPTLSRRLRACSKTRRCVFSGRKSQGRGRPSVRPSDHSRVSTTRSQHRRPRPVGYQLCRSQQRGASRLGLSKLRTGGGGFGSRV